MIVLRVFNGAVGAGRTAGSGVAALGRGAGERTLVVAGDLTGRAAVGTVRQALGSRHTAEALDLVLRSAVAERAVNSLLDGPLLDAAARATGRHAVVERVSARVIDSPDFERVVMAAFESDGAERIFTQVLASPMLDTLIRRLLESEELWRLVDGIARSPVVRDAITQSSRGFADEVAGEVRERSRGADAWLERVARRVGPHRREDGAPPSRLIPEHP